MGQHLVVGRTSHTRRTSWNGQFSLATIEVGGTATPHLRLTDQPDQDVTVTAISDNTNEAMGSSALTFTLANWNVAQEFVATQKDHSADDSDVISKSPRQ